MSFSLLIIIVIIVIIVTFILYKFIKYLITKNKHNDIKQRNLLSIKSPFYDKVTDTKLYDLTSWMLPKIINLDKDI